MIQLVFNVSGQVLKRIDETKIVSDTIGQFEAVFTFDAWWDNYTPTVQFIKNSQAYDCLLENNRCFVPPEAMEKGGVFYVSVFATEDANRKTANAVAIKVDASGYNPKGSHSISPTPTVIEQLLKKVENIKSYIANLAEKIPDDIAIEDGTIALLSKGQKIGGGAELPKITVDSELSAESENPVQNNVVAEAIKKTASDIDDLKLYTDNLTYLEKLTLTQETAKMISTDGIVGVAAYSRGDNAFTIQIFAPIKAYGENWKIEPFDDNMICDDFIACGYIKEDEDAEPEYFELTKADVEGLFEAPFYNGQYSWAVRWCGVQYISGLCCFGYSNAWDFTSFIENLETEEEKQTFINEVEEMVKDFNADFEAFNIDKISVIKTVKNLPIKERIVS